MKKISALIILGCVFCIHQANAAEMSKKIDAHLAHELAKLSLDYHNKGGALEFAPKASDNDFFVFQGIGTQSTFGWYAVNSWTGDVWNTMSCQRLSNPELRVEQEKIKKQFNENQMKEYDQLHALGPHRVSDLELCDSSVR